MMIHEITSKVAPYKTRKRCGRGNASGIGGTSGRGHKGAKSRAGWSRRVQYDGGSINFIQKLPKRGFTNAPFKKHFVVINVSDLNALANHSGEVTVETLAQAGIVRDASMPLKVLGNGELKAKVSVVAARFSASAKAKIESAGGKVTEQPAMKWTRTGPVPAINVPRKPKPVEVATKAEGGKSAKPKAEGEAPKESAPKAQKESAPKKEKKEKKPE
ncbi:MAG TPA: 50S ribosomal protein L15 [Phycisphaerales bacterium]|nr:50S ribosomal protein L15 [Phycisphaerales bacterium]